MGRVMEHLTIYGDFNCPYSYLASARADRLVARGLVSLEWRAVEHAPWIPEAGWTVGGETASLLSREIEQVTRLARELPLPIRLPSVLPNTARAVAAFAGAEPHDALEIRWRLFGALWAQDRDIGDPAVLSQLTGGREGWNPGRVEHWRGAWHGIDQPVVPLVMLRTGIVLRGVEALDRLALFGIDEPDDRRRRSSRRARGASPGSEHNHSTGHSSAPAVI